MTGKVIRIPFRSDLSREDELALEAATEWILAEIENNAFLRAPNGVSINVMRVIANKELRRPRDATHRRWAELFIRETNEIEFDNVRPEIRKLVQRGNVTKEEVAGLRCNSWEWEALIPVLTDEAFVAQMEHAISNCYVAKKRPFSTYNDAVEGLYAPELLKRFRVAAQEARAFAETIDNVRAALGQDGTHYLIIADDVKELVEAVEKQGGAALETLEQIRERGRMNKEHSK